MDHDRPDLRGWIDIAVQFPLDLISQVEAGLVTIRTEWDSFTGQLPAIDAVISWWGNWTGNVLTAVNSWWSARLLDVQGLINSAFVVREDLWTGWQDMRDQVVEFFTDPLGFLEGRLADWFLGPEV